jgi:hypothetical protein
MKALDYEDVIERVFRVMTRNPHLKVPTPDAVHLKHDGKAYGRANTKQIWISLDLTGEPSITNTEFINTLCHEVVHYNGISGHSAEFWNAFNLLYNRVVAELRLEGVPI